MIDARHFCAPPRLSLRAWAVWQRNFLVWRKLAIPSLLGHLADPMIYMFGLGYGLSSVMANETTAFGGVSYLAFLAAGTVSASTMNAASFEALYSAFSRMHVQRTWEAILLAPLSLDDILLGELLWAASKASLSGLAIMAVMALLGLGQPALWLWALPAIALTALCFAALGLIITARAPSYDFFMYYFTLVITPMTLLSGVFFPLAALPPALQELAWWLPLTHAVALTRPLLFGELPAAWGWHIAVLSGLTLVSFWLAVMLTRRRLLT